MNNFNVGDKVIISKEAWMALAVHPDVNPMTRGKLLMRSSREGKVHNPQFPRMHDKIPIWIEDIGWEWFNLSDIRPYNKSLNDLVTK